MSLQMALQVHFESTLAPQSAAAEVDGVSVMGLVGIPEIVESSLASLIELIQKWLRESDVLPPKDQVLTWVGEAFDTYLAPLPPFAGRPFITKLARQGLLAAVAALYDSID